MEKDLIIPYILYKTGPFFYPTHPEIIECFKENEKMLQCKIEYFNGTDRYIFIKNHFDANVVKAYDTLIPGAYKADLWRLCVLYIHGGIYGDLTQTFLREYDVNKDNADIILVRDREYTWLPSLASPNIGIYNAFMAAKKHNGFIKYCIEKIVEQILIKNKGKNPLDITGPVALKRHYFTFFNINKINLGLQELTGIDNKIYRINIPFIHTVRVHQVCITENNEIIINNYIKNHRELLYNARNIHYDELYNKNKVFKLDEMEVRRQQQQQQQQQLLRNLRIRNRKIQLRYKMLNMSRQRLRRHQFQQLASRKRFMIMK